MFSDSALFSKILPGAAGGSHLKAGTLPPEPPPPIVPELEEPVPEVDVPEDEDEAIIEDPVLPPVPLEPAPPDDDEAAPPSQAMATAEKARSVVHADVFTHEFIRLHLQRNKHQSYNILPFKTLKSPLLSPKLHLSLPASGQIAVLKMHDF